MCEADLVQSAPSAGVQASALPLKRPSESVSTHLPVFGDCVPHPHLPRVAGGDELVTNKEESLSGDIETEDACGEGETSLFLLLGTFPEQLIEPTSRFPGTLRRNSYRFHCRCHQGKWTRG